MTPPQRWLKPQPVELREGLEEVLREQRVGHVVLLQVRAIRLPKW